MNITEIIYIAESIDVLKVMLFLASLIGLPCSLTILLVSREHREIDEDGNYQLAVRAFWIFVLTSVLTVILPTGNVIKSYYGIEINAGESK